MRTVIPFISFVVGAALALSGAGFIVYEAVFAADLVVIYMIRALTCFFAGTSVMVFGACWRICIPRRWWRRPTQPKVLGENLTTFATNVVEDGVRKAA